jgi:proline iminopeptidase
MRRFARLLATSLTAYALFIRPRLLRCLDNFGRRSSESIHQEWQEVNVGDFLGSPNVSELERKAWQVAALEPQRFLGLRASIDLLGRHFDPSQERPRYYSDSLWGFLLKELPGGKTRLIVSGYWSLEPRWLFPVVSFTLYEWTHWIMQTRQLANLKRLTETPAAHVPV